MKPAITIRLADEADATAIVEIYNWYVANTTCTFDTSPQQAQTVAKWIRNQTLPTPVFVAVVSDTRNDGSIGGWARIKPWSDRGAYAEAAEVSVFVDTRFRGKGIGQALGQHLIGHARSNGWHTLIARIGEGNHASLKFFEHLGFESAGFLREVGIKFDQRLGNHIYQIVLDRATDQT